MKYKLLLFSLERKGKGNKKKEPEKCIENDGADHEAVQKYLGLGNPLLKCSHSQRDRKPLDQNHGGHSKLELQRNRVKNVPDNTHRSHECQENGD